MAASVVKNPAIFIVTLSCGRVLSEGPLAAAYFRKNCPQENSKAAPLVKYTEKTTSPFF